MESLNNGPEQNIEKGTNEIAESDENEELTEEDINNFLDQEQHEALQGKTLEIKASIYLKLECS